MFAALPVPPLTAGRLLTGFHADPLVIGTLLAAGMAYLGGVVRLRRRGDRWPAGRSAAWLTGLCLVGYALIGGLGGYDDVLFSAHMAQHVVLAMIAPIGLALGGPVTLALRTLPAPGRRMVLAAVHSRVARVFAFPLTGLALLFASLVGLYFTGLYAASLQHPLLHDAIHVHFLVVGCVFYWPILGIDPLPSRPPHWARLLVVVAALPFHAFLGLALMQSSTALAGPYYTALHLHWAGSPLADQHLGGGIMWATGDLVGLLVFVVVLAQWMSADQRTAVRIDRIAARADAAAAAGQLAHAAALHARTADVREAAQREEAALSAAEDAYNNRLAALAARDSALATRGRRR